MIQEMLVTHMHNHGFGFGCVWNADGQPEQCFIPAPLAANQNLDAGDRVRVIVSPNFADKSEGTPWQVIKIMPKDEILADGKVIVRHSHTPREPDKIAQARDDLDDRVLAFIKETGYATAAEIAASVGVDPQTASNSAQRHFNANKIARAAVYHRADQSRASFVLYASEANDFLEVT